MRYIKIVFIALTFIIGLGFYSLLEAQSRYGNTEIGIILGEPTGVSLKAWQSRSTAIDGALAWSFSGNESFHIHADHLWHNWLDSDTGELAFYYGLGARALLSDNSRLGVRIPIGLQYLVPDDHRISLFFEVAPTLNLIPDTDVDVSGGLGVRLFL